MPSRRLIPRAAAVVSAATAIPVLAANEPVLIDPGVFVNVVRMPDGSVKRVRANNGYLKSQTSLDNGLTWGSEIFEFSMTGGTNPVPFLDSSGRIHYTHSQLRDETNGGTRILGVNYFLDVWHYGPDGTGQYVSTMAAPAYTGSIMDAMQLANGRLIIPYGDRYTTPSGGYGNFRNRVVYSDDLGQTWQVSPSEIRSPLPADWNGSPDGACEPTVTQLANGQVLMYMRTQAGRLYESRSNDNGATWSEGKPTNFHTSTGPPAFQRLDDGRLVLMWNNATMPPKYQGDIVYAGRDALHAAISSDDGKTWSGFREIYLDPFRNNNPQQGDTGTAYVFPTETADHHVLAIAGQAQSKTMIRFDPDWLLETSRSDDFSDGFDNWSVFKPFGPVVSVKRNRKIGPALVFDAQENKDVMHVRRPDSDDPDGAIWNFPMAKKGQTEIRVKIAPGFAGGVISLSDRFLEPTDSQGEASAVFQVPITVGGILPGGAVLTPSQWHTLGLNWDLHTHRATLLLDGQPVGVLDQRVQALPGPSYLRFRSTAATIDTAGFYVSSVAQTGLPTGPVRESINFTTAEAASALAGGGGWTSIRFDDYVPNNNATPSGNGPTGVFTGTFTGFVSPTTGATPVGLLLESSDGSVIFTDGTSTQVTSDVTGPKLGGTLTLTFVDPSDPAKGAVVSRFAFRFGSTVADNVEIKLYDINGVELPDYLVQTLEASVAGSTAGMYALEDLAEAAAIHKIVFTATDADTWLLGSFGQSNALADFAFADFTVVPESGAATAIIALALAGLSRRRVRRGN